MGRGPRIWSILLHQFTSPLIYILLIVMMVTLVIQHWADAIVIGAVVLLNAAVGFFQEQRAENAMQALIKLVSVKATVLRDGRQQDIDGQQLVPGDIVFLESGDLVPADLRLIHCTRLAIEESLLTGESVPVNKTSEPIAVASAVSPGDLKNMAFMGTAVASGRGIGVVVATGLSTQTGAIAGEMRRTERAETPLQSRMHQLGRWISVAIVGTSALAFAIGLALRLPLVEMFLTAVAIAVSAIPEGLPVAMTIALSVAANRMAKRRAVIRRLVAVETLGSCTVIVTDKTGTLTENRMTVQSIWTSIEFYQVTGSGLGVEGAFTIEGSAVDVKEGSPLYLTLLAGLMANEASLESVDNSFVAHGDPTEVALLVSCAKAQMSKAELMSRYPRIDQVPFESVRRYSASVHRDDEGEIVFVKGAPERLMEMCDSWMTSEGPQPIDRAVAIVEAEKMAQQGFRVLAFATSRNLESIQATRSENPSGLILLGLQGMMDPPRSEVIPAIAACKRAGIRVIMATGDHASTASAIARMIGLNDEKAEVRTGAELEAMSEDEFKTTLRDVSIYSRVSPSQKLQIVNELRAQGQIVAVTGDGVNDAPALKSAHIGAAMGLAGTDVAREASDMVLADDNFATVYAAVEEGRTAFSNIRKVTFYLLSSGVGEMLAILASLVLRMPLPLLPTQILWMNLVTNGIEDVALAFEPGEPHQNRRPPRNPKEGILSRVMVERILIVGIVMAAGSLVMFAWELERGSTLAYAQVTALTTLVIFQIFHVGNSRSEELSVFRKNPLANPVLFYGTIVTLVVHIGAMYFPPTQLLIRLEPLSFHTWVRLCLVALSVVLVVELHKLLRRPKNI
jgi:Ca2+-transporting ATPase